MTPPLSATILAASSWSVAGADPNLAELPILQASDGLFRLSPEPTRPERIAPAAWRRLSRLARIVATVADAVLETPDDSRESQISGLPVFWGTSGGEFTSTAAFLRSLHARGPAGASPLIFQNAVHNAPASHLSILFGLKDHSETICAGPETTFRTFERALCHLRVHGGQALVVIADDLGPDVQVGMNYAFADPAQPARERVFSEGAAAFLLSAGGAGPRVVLADTASDLPGYQRGLSWPAEEQGEQNPSLEAHDLRLGTCPASDAVALASLVRHAAVPGRLFWSSGGIGMELRVYPSGSGR